MWVTPAFYMCIIYMPSSKKPRTHKRCPNGSRWDTKSLLCVRYTNVKSFDKLTEITISETKPTITFESLGKDNKDGAIVKIYKEGELEDQLFISPEKVKKVQQKTKEQSAKTRELLKKIEKNPDMIKKDKKFKNFQSKIAKTYNRKRNNKTAKEGTESSPQEPLVTADIFIDNEIVNAPEMNTTEESSTFQDWWTNRMAYNLITLYQGYIADSAVFDYMNNIGVSSVSNLDIAAKTTFAIGTFDMASSLFMALLNILPKVMPDIKEVDEIVTIATYIFYAIYIPINIALGWIGIAYVIMPIINIWQMTHRSNET